MSLIARLVEAAGIPTLSMSCARDITEAANPPRATFLDWPLGRTSGRPGRPDVNVAVVRAALAEFERIETPGTIVDLDVPWADDDDWKDGVMRSQPRPQRAGASAVADDRVERWPTPQYQSGADADAAEARHGGQDCAVCAGIDY